MKIFFVLLLIGSMLSSCVDTNFFQEDALATEEEVTAPGSLPEDSVWVIAGRHYKRNGLHRFFWGDHNRQVWTTPVKAKVFDLNKVKGGLTVIKQGGGFQTTNFHLQDSLGRLYAFRSLDKDPVHVVAKFWQPTFVTNVLRDQTSAANPYAALVVPVLAQAVGVYHTNPELYYVAANDTSFGKYAAEVQGKLFLLEEKYETPADITASFKQTVTFKDSEDALKNRFRSNLYHFDQKAFARARLLDVMIGDWDRHKGQWSWAAEKHGTETVYKPIPKDRDQVFIKMNDGLIPAIATSKFMARKLHSFSEKYTDIRALMINSAFLDERFLTELSREEWQHIAQNMQASLTDQVLQQAVQQLPEAIYTLMGNELLKKLKSRRDNLPEAATEMYEILAKEVIIAGSDEEEIFTVKRLNNNQTEVTVMREAQDKIPAKQLFHRVFYTSETEKISLYGLAEEDAFTVSGTVGDGILIEIYGGVGEDRITDNSSVKGWKSMTHIYDTERGNEIIFGTEAKDNTTRDVQVHAFDREGN